MLKPVNRKISLLLIALAIFYLYLAYQLPSFANSVINASTMPKILGFGLIALSLFLFFIPDQETKEDKKKRHIPKADLIKIAGVVLMILAYIFFLERLGFILVSFLFIFFCSYFLGYTKHSINLLVSILFPALLYSVFTMLLGISLPSGIIPF
ncbi:tripartite tricarboxylate transporter TctB family protein [Alteribacillus bidgolensis]|uniref:Putative tricarboxylic transport membrane protein n=1 Tax=Alteribacillus bidgolensis TaxID=930129 RepID=A0A1G8L350_9BACI|nr:tripartite tricarboxylate transporter TctB family protein [Alteribacillus bidgolensis]SDI50103.1 putative tricarboxylic transport membrane protein [Alteribacillus bidgolensis]